MIRIRDEIVSKLLDLSSKHSDVSTCKLTVLLNHRSQQGQVDKIATVTSRRILVHTLLLLLLT